MKQENPYPVLGGRPVAARGRQRVLDRLLDHVTKPQPDHVSLVAPKLMGKTTVLRALAEEVATPGHGYLVAHYWDIGHNTPATDDAFRLRLAAELRNALAGPHPELADWLPADLDADSFNDAMDALLETLTKDKRQVLLVLDGFDKVLATGTLTRGLWDNLRTLAVRGPLKLVTGSSRRLQDLCRDEDSRTSDFWEIFFDTPVKVGPFTADELADVVEPFAEQRVTVDKGALTELANWTGGAPPLVAWMLHRSWAETEPPAAVSPDTVNRLGEAFLSEPPSLADALWLDCDAPEQEHLMRLAAGDIATTEVPPGVRQSLLARGYAMQQQGRLVGACRLMLGIAQSRTQGVADLRRLFGTPAAYGSAMPAVLALRLEQIGGLDPRLQAHAEHVVRDLATDPELALTGIRALVNCALDLAVAASFPTREVPREWITQWQHDGVRLDGISRVCDGKLPTDRSQQIRLLATCCGSDLTDPVSIPVPKAATLLLQHLPAGGNYGQHLDTPGGALRLAVSASLSALDLCECLAVRIATARVP